MSELLSNDRWVEKHLTPPGFVPGYAAMDFILATSFTSEWEQ